MKQTLPGLFYTVHKGSVFLLVLASDKVDLGTILHLAQPGLKDNLTTCVLSTWALLLIKSFI